MEIWTNVEDYPNYLVSNRGRVKNAKTNRILKYGSSGDICSCINGKLDSYRGLHFVRI